MKFIPAKHLFLESLIFGKSRHGNNRKGKNACGGSL